MITQDLNSVAPISLRCVLVLDKQPNGTQATIGDVLSDTSGITAWLTTMPDAVRKHRFDILWDNVVLLPGIATTLGNGPAVVQRLSYYKRVNIFTQFDADSATPAIGDISSGNIFLMFMHNKITSAFPLLNYSSRIKFKD